MPNDDEPLRLLTRTEITRRDALKLFGAGLAALQVGCFERPGEEIRPAVRRVEDSADSQLYATSMVLDGFATGLLVQSRSGRPTKIDGNPAHPASLGATLSQHQASILDLYDPNRLRGPREGDLPSSWDRVRAVLGQLPPGELWLVLPPDASPTIAATLDRVRARHPGVHVVHHSVVRRDEVYAGSTLAFGAALEQQLAFDRADVVVSLDADPFASMPMAVRWSRDYALRRRRVERGDNPNRLFVAEPMLTPTGSLADHRLALRAGEIAAVAVLLVEALDRRGVATIVLPLELRRAARQLVGDAPWIDLAAGALVRAGGSAIVIAGERQPAAVHALAHRIALSIGAIGRTTTFTDAVLAEPANAPRIVDLAAAIRAGRVGTVIAIDCDPVHDAPAALGLGELFARVPLTMHATMHPSSTSAVSRWVLPLSHYLESWGDARAWDGTVSPIQPLIRPLHDTHSRLELLAMLAGDRPVDDLALVRQHWLDVLGGEVGWRAMLGEGIVPNTTLPPQSVGTRGDEPIVRALAATLNAPPPAIEVDLAPSPSIGDGRFANNPWLQELPHPITKLTWGNAAMLSAATAQRLGVGDGRVIRLAAGNYSVDAPALITPGHADGCITLELGYGQRSAAAPIGHAVGVNAAPLAMDSAIVRAVQVTATGRSVALARTQQHLGEHGRDTAVHTDLASYHRNPELTAALRGPLPTLLDGRERAADIPQWAMTIDTTICTGCSSCVVACQAENNIAVVGAREVRRGREMHWLRIDTYVEDTSHGVEVVHQPMLCQHCEHAPCEYVCPVFATAHSPDGLNEMTYNRCVGTRFCSNNCPYKVRRFNWFAYNQPATLRSLQYNPDVTVRARGVMEKCTFCVQRIRGAEVRARMEKRPIREGEVLTACQQACPTTAIQFAALQHGTTEMVKRRSPRSYGVLHELGTRPRVMYLAKVRNPDPDATE